MKKKNKRNYYWGKSECCKAEVEYNGGGYDGEEIVPVVSRCMKCGRTDPEIIQRVGRPSKLVF